MRLLADFIRRTTGIPKTYREHAAYQSIDAYLDDWRKAHDQLGKRIEALQALRDERALQVLQGEWPPAALEEPVPERPQVEDLLANLERSIVAAKAARARHFPKGEP